MPQYSEFAEFYAQGPYTQFSQRMAQRMPSLLEELDVKPEVILDMACGEGTFAIEMAKLGYQVVGIDRSPSMIRIAERKAKEAGVEVDFRMRNMSSMIFEDSFDLVTCWFDSLNYIWSLTELQTTFQRVHRALHPGGLFIFDVNTIHGLAHKWAEKPVSIEWKDNDHLVIHESSYNHEMNMATIQITALKREGELWRRVDETHMEKGFYQWEIRNALRDAGLRQLATLGNIMDMTKAEPDSPRVWNICQKPFEQPVPDDVVPLG